MATISYSVSGEGRGHAARARVVIDHLRHRHRLIVYCYGDAWDLLSPVCGGWNVEVRRIPGLRFAYDTTGKLSRSASLVKAFPYLTSFPDWVLRLARRLERDRTDLAIADFEPLLPRAAQLARIPAVSLDHQRFLVSCDLAALPPHLLGQARLLGTLCQPFYPHPTKSVISSFFSAPLKPTAKDVRQVGVLLRREIESATPTAGRHLVAYVRKTPPREVMEALKALRHPVHVYGPNRSDRDGHLHYRAIDPARFAEDLASCRALVTTAGNQVVGEALSLGKPVLAFPEPGNIEQQINGHFLSALGTGLSIPARAFREATVRDFLDRHESLASRISPETMNGTHHALSAIEGVLKWRPGAAFQNGGAARPAAAGLRL